MNFDKVSKNIFLVFKKSLKKKDNRSTFNHSQMNEILKNNNSVILLDVRSVQEYNEGHINGAINIPLSELKISANKYMNANDMIIVYCQIGKRSKKAVNILNKMGYNNVHTLEGGLDAYLRM